METKKYTGLVKWFHDLAKDANYGFIQHAILGDLFFHERSIEQGQNLESFRENETVVFISQLSKKHEGKLEAVHVKLLSTETDLNFLFNQFLSILTEKGKYSDYNNIQKAVHARIKSLLEKTEDPKITDELYQQYHAFLSSQLQLNELHDILFLKGILNVCKNFFPDHYSDISKTVELRIDINTAHNLWLERYIENCQVQFVSDSVLNEPQRVLENILGKCTELDKINISDYFLQNFSSPESSIYSDEVQLRKVLNIFKLHFPDKYAEVVKKIESNINTQIAHNLWKDRYLETCQFTIVSGLIQSEPQKSLEYILSICTETDKVNISNCFLENIKDIALGTYSDEVRLKIILYIFKHYFPGKLTEITKTIELNISPSIAHSLWLDKYTYTCQVDFISCIILSSDKQTQQSIFKCCTEEDKTNIFFKLLYNFDIIDSLPKLNDIKEFLNLVKEFGPTQYEKIIDAILNNCSADFRLNLWLEDYHKYLDFNAYKQYTIILSPEDQKKFVKKVLKYIHEEKVLVSIDDFTSLNVIDYATSKLVERIDESHLDYSTSIILNVISELKSQTIGESKKEMGVAQNKIFDLILKQIREPKDILQITGYFDECEGRCSVSVVEEKNEQGEEIGNSFNYKRNQYNKPRLHPICDGRKAINKSTNEPILDELSKAEFWWCTNQKCFLPSRKLHKSEEWEKYTLLDFLTILKVQYREVDLEIYLNIINKANRFLKHLKCRKCDHILYPIGKTQYAFYGVSNFICKNEDCSEVGKEIYLSHCLNGLCEMEIDSRDCVKCKPLDHDQDSCGWYVCNYCHSCCSSPPLEKRKWVYDNILHKDYKCHLIGHKELGIISCNKCGDSMESNEINSEEYRRILDWFIENKDRSDNIHKSGKSKHDKWWFAIRRGSMSPELFREKLTKYYQLGFKIPDYDQEKDMQLISEPFDIKKHSSDILTCKSCGNTLDLSSDFERARAIRSFHNVRFVNVPAEH